MICSICYTYCTCSEINVIVQVKIWHLPVDVSHDSVCNPSTTLCTGDGTVELVLWNPVAENVLASAAQQSVKIYDVEQQNARIGDFLQIIIYLCAGSERGNLLTMQVCVLIRRVKLITLLLTALTKNSRS